ncbi:MAG TPA: helix-hairpin-helix domain-containing protein [Motilibacteraceae bacterium]|nr:helix-hairpin-helix domain-containing protein [Motilibacteraceae bacterium]
MSRRSDRLARDVHERLAAVAGQLAGGPAPWAQDEPPGPGGAGSADGGWVPGRPEPQPVDGRVEGWVGEGPSLVSELFAPEHAHVDPARSFEGTEGTAGTAGTERTEVGNTGLEDARPERLAGEGAGGEGAAGVPARAAGGRQREGAHRARRGVGVAGRRRRPDDPAPGGGRETGLGRPAVVGLAVVALLAAALAGGLMWRSRPVPVEAAPPRAAGGAAQASPGPVRTVSSARAAPSQPSLGTPAAPTGPGGSGSAGSSPGGAPALVVVHVVGQVRHPGLVHLPQGARVDDAVRAAGGATAAADLSGVNLARVVVDGEQLRVPSPGEVVAPPPGSGSAAGPPAEGAPAAPVDLNSATLAELDALPGVGPVLAQRILDWRGEHQRFSSVDELREVRGIGPKVFADLQPLVRV